MSDFLMSGPAYFPGWVSILFSAGLALGIAHHLPCLIGNRTAGWANRWFHAGHTAMALSMIYMYLSMSYDWDWLPGKWQMWFFVAASVAVAVHLAVSAARRQVIDVRWILLLIHLGAMAYMWFPMMRWNAILIYVLVSWFAAEAFGWLTDVFPSRSGLLTATAADRVLMAIMAVSMGYMFYGMELMGVMSHSMHSMHSMH